MPSVSFPPAFLSAGANLRFRENPLFFLHGQFFFLFIKIKITKKILPLN